MFQTTWNQKTVFRNTGFSSSRAEFKGSSVIGQKGSAFLEMFSESRNWKRAVCLLLRWSLLRTAAFIADLLGNLMLCNDFFFVLMEVKHHIHGPYFFLLGKQLQRCFHSFAIGVRGKRV